jgi:hypothetical protein
VHTCLSTIVENACSRAGNSCIEFWWIQSRRHMSLHERVEESVYTSI